MLAITRFKLKCCIDLISYEVTTVFRLTLIINLLHLIDLYISQSLFYKIKHYSNSYSEYLTKNLGIRCYNILTAVLSFW